MKKILVASFIIFFLFLFTVRGNLGNPTPRQIDVELNNNGQAFESSQERSRYAIILALVNDHRFDLGQYASMGTPDIGRIKGKYYSFFPPAASMLAIPLYLLGRSLGVAQLLTFFISTIFCVATIVLIYKFMKSLGSHWTHAMFAAIAFAFATNAWGYSVTLYAHLLSACFILGGIYVATRRPINWQNTSLVWLFYAIAIFVDFPNIFAYFPIALLMAFRLFTVTPQKNHFRISMNFSMAIGPILFALCMGIYGYYNYAHFGSPMKLSNTIDRVRDLKKIQDSTPEKKGTTSTGALQTRNLINGLYTFTVSHDRGILIYSPVILLFVFGLYQMSKKNTDVKLLLTSVPLVNLLTYSMFGDPYGGWAYGSRYMIAVVPELLIIAGMGLEYVAGLGKKMVKYTILTIYSCVFIYSSSMSLLSPLTTNVIPPSIEAGGLALADDYRINKEMLQLNHLNSYVYNNYFKQKITGYTYYYAILIPLNLYVLTLIWWPIKRKGKGIT